MKKSYFIRFSCTMMFGEKSLPYQVGFVCSLNLTPEQDTDDLNLRMFSAIEEVVKKHVKYAYGDDYTEKLQIKDLDIIIIRPL